MTLVPETQKAVTALTAVALQCRRQHLLDPRSVTATVQTPRPLHDLALQLPTRQKMILEIL